MTEAPIDAATNETDRASGASGGVLLRNDNGREIRGSRPSTEERKQWGREMRRRTPEQWEALVREVPESVRGHVASIVWWDFFAGRKATEPWRHLDQHRALYRRDAPEDCVELAEALKSVGYLEGDAIVRAGIRYPDWREKPAA